MAGQEYVREVSFGPDQALTFVYTNHRGETARRRVLPERIWFGSTDWYPAPQWLLEAFDLDRKAIRVFSLTGIEHILGDTGGDVSHRSADKGSAERV
jgi:hypothetical protein